MAFTINFKCALVFVVAIPLLFVGVIFIMLVSIPLFKKVQAALDRCEENNVSEWSAIKSTVRDSLGRFLFERTRRRPMILPIIMEI